MIARLAILLLWAASQGMPAFAGRECVPQRPEVSRVESRLTLAAETLRILEGSGDKVALIARAGQDLSAHGLRYSHLGFAYRDDGTWRVAHKLNGCGTAVAHVYRQGLAEFFLESDHRLEGAILFLEPAVADALQGLLFDDRLLAMHTPAYSVVAYPFATRYQQSNQWAIETLAVALAPEIGSRREAQLWLKNRRYQPSRLRLSTLTRLGARLTRTNIEFDDHPAHLRFSGRIDTVTVDSVFAWLSSERMAQRIVPLGG